MEYVWTWGGIFFGYTQNKNLFTATGKCVGSFQGKEIYDKSGAYLGEIMNDNRLITSLSKRSYRGAPSANVVGGAIARYANYAGYAMYAGYEDFPHPDVFDG